MGERVVVETTCEHGEVSPHWLMTTTVTAGMGYTKPVAQCPGGQRRELTGVEVVETETCKDEHPSCTTLEAYDLAPGRYAIIPLEKEPK